MNNPNYRFLVSKTDKNFQAFFFFYIMQHNALYGDVGFVLGENGSVQDSVLMYVTFHNTLLIRVYKLLNLYLWVFYRIIKNK